MGRIVAISSGNLLTTRPLNKYAIKLSKKQNPRVLFVGTASHDAQEYIPPEWFGEEVTDNICFHNSRISRMKADERLAFVAKYAIN